MLFFRCCFREEKCTKHDTRGYIYTYELKDQLANTELRNMKDQAFRMRIIGKLRDKGVIIASSQKGYKIPSKQAELDDQSFAEKYLVGTLSSTTIAIIAALLLK